ncbi:MAG: hypothetical protein SGJ24_10325 [Chloroflexota bacterium]|nr:hypothetical protein [Chloroflexota bacterium]
MTNNSARRASIILGVFMVIVLLAGSIIPIFTGNQQPQVEQPQVNPTEAPIPTFPAPPTDLTAVTFDQVYLHPTGIFSIGQPIGWTASEPNKGATIAQVNLINNDSQTVVDTYVEDAGAIQPAELDAHFSREAIGASWARFNQWSETNREFNEETGRLVIDFNVTSNRQQFVARQQAWTDGRWVYVVRVLTPANATQFLLYLLEGFSNSLQAYTGFEGSPLDWTAHYDSVYNHIIRYPGTWTLTDSAPGAPASITSADGVQLRVQGVADTQAADEAAARAYVESLRPGITVASVMPIDRAGTNGFAVGYTYSTIDGEGQSGYVNLLNGADGALHVADLRFPAPNVDLNALMTIAGQPVAEATPEMTPDAEATPEAPTMQLADESLLGAYAGLSQVLGTFQVIAPIPLAVQPA